MIVWMFYVECIHYGYIKVNDWAAYIEYCGTFVINIIQTDSSSPFY